MAQSQISNNDDNNKNNKMPFHLPPASIQVQSDNDKGQKSNGDTMDQVQEQQSVQSAVEQQPRRKNVENRHSDNSFLSELMSTVQNCTVVWDNTTRSYRDLHYSLHILVDFLWKYEICRCVYFTIKLTIQLNIVHETDPFEFEHLLPRRQVLVCLQGLFSKIIQVNMSNFLKKSYFIFILYRSCCKI